MIRSSDAEAPATSSTYRRDRAQRTVSACSGLGAFLNSLFTTVRVLDEERTWKGLSEHCRGALTRFLGEPELRGAWEAPAGEADAVVLGVLDELGELDDLAPAPTIETFAAAFTAALDRPCGNAGRMDQGVVLGDLGAMSGLDLDLLVVLGGVEGMLPGNPPPSPLLSREGRSIVGLDPSTRSFVIDRDRASTAAGVRWCCCRTVMTAPQVTSSTSAQRVVSRYVRAQPIGAVIAYEPEVLAEIGNGQRRGSGTGDLRSAVLLTNGRHSDVLSDLLATEPDLAHRSPHCCANVSRCRSTATRVECTAPIPEAICSTRRSHRPPLSSMRHVPISLLRLP